ncbi:ABC transporter permease [Paenibacillus sp.]|uniref:ABC transporter permease n=1 Tax=Paenibacillus sp. TaxID=58172 RepID=UPI002D4AB596|nr:ABC transporter permease [Paenibacillus sp.]HZG87441.1 ABC transporter permease [Paenibacillus sp.]
MSVDIGMEQLIGGKQFEIGRKANPIAKWAKLLWQSKTGTVGFVVVILACLTAVFAPLLAPHDPTLMNARNTLAPPVWLEGGTTAHILGTDNLGRDVLSRVIYGSQVSLLVSGVSVVIAGFIGIALGVVCGFYGGRWFDTIVMRIVDAKLAIPGILLLLVVIGVFGTSITTLILVLGLTEWTNYTRLIRGEVLSLTQRDYIRAARSIGTKDRTIMLKHILPNISSICIVISTLTVGTNILIEAGISYLGLGIQPPTVSWGYMLSEGRDHIATSWWIAAFPGIAITITVLGIIFLGDWLRDVFDPRAQSRRS